MALYNSEFDITQQDKDSLQKIKYLGMLPSYDCISWFTLSIFIMLSQSCSNMYTESRQKIMYLGILASYNCISLLTLGERCYKGASDTIVLKWD